MPIAHREKWVMLSLERVSLTELEKSGLSQCFVTHQVRAVLSKL